jgi:HK97 gp10 family phage protein
MARLQGLDQALKELQTLRVRAQKAMRRGELKVAKIMVDEAKAAAPFDMGNIEAGIHIEQTESSTIVVGGDKLAAYQEFGTGPLVSIPTGVDAAEVKALFYVNGKGKTPPHPFFYPAVFRNEELIIPAVEEELRKL